MAQRRVRRARRWCRGAGVAAVLIGAALLPAPGVWAGCDASTLCAAGACTITGTHAIDDGCTLDFDAVGVTALTLVGTLETAAAGHGFTMRLAALDGTGTLRAPGGRVTVQTTSPTNPVTFAGTIDVRPGGTAILYGGAGVTLSGEIAADGTTPPDAGSIEISGTTVDVSGSAHANGGTHGRGGRLTVVSRTGHLATTASATLAANGSGAAADGGTLEITAATTLTVHGNVLAEGAGNGDGGAIRLVAGGTFTASQTIEARATGTATAANGGEIRLLATGATLTGALRASGLGNGEGGTIRVKLTAGDFTMPSGTIDVGSGDGGDAGDFALVAPADVLLGGTITANATGPTSTGGAITVEAGDVVTVTGPLEARSTTPGGAQEEALIDLSGCMLDIRAPILARSATGSGQTRFSYTQGMTVTDASVLADDAGANVIGCACQDADQDGTCETPLTCRADPVLTNATATPAVRVHPEYPTVCG